MRTFKTAAENIFGLEELHSCERDDIMQMVCESVGLFLGEVEISTARLSFRGFFMDDLCLVWVTHHFHPSPFPSAQDCCLLRRDCR